MMEDIEIYKYHKEIKVTSAAFQNVSDLSNYTNNCET